MTVLKRDRDPSPQPLRTGGCTDSAGSDPCPLGRWPLRPKADSGLWSHRPLRTGPRPSPGRCRPLPSGRGHLAAALGVLLSVVAQCPILLW